MRLLDLFESLSRVAYHYTNVAAATKILQSGEFQLTSVLGSVEQQYAPKDKPYFLSTTRTRHGGYHSMVGSSAAMFVLNGDWFNQHYVSRPVDYWENRDPKKVSHRPHEAEDRVFSREPTIPIDGVTEVHILSKPQGGMGVHARRALIAAKRTGIPVYFYEDESAWRNLNKAQAVPISDRPTLRGQEQFRWGATRKGYMQPWAELIAATNKQQLSSAADRLRNSIVYYQYDRQNAADGLRNDLSNARKPASGHDRELAVKIIRYMQQHKLTTVDSLVDSLVNKWTKISQETTNEPKTRTTSQQPGRSVARNNAQSN